MSRLRLNVSSNILLFDCCTYRQSAITGFLMISYDENYRCRLHQLFYLPLQLKCVCLSAEAFPIIEEYYAL